MQHGAGVHARGADVSFRDVKIETSDRKRTGGMWMTSWPEAWGEIWEKSVSLLPASERKSRVLASEEDGWLSELAEALRWVRTWCGEGVRWKSLHRKIVRLSLCRKTIKLKGNKKFRTWSKEVVKFFVFRDSYVIYICALWTLWTFYVPVWVCLFHIHISGYVTKGLLLGINYYAVFKLYK